MIDIIKELTHLIDKLPQLSIWIFGLDGKTSVRRQIGLASAVDLAKKLSETFHFKCKKCKRKLSLEKGEIHHGCLKCT